MRKEFVDYPGIIDKDQLDAIRLEASSLTPTEELNIRTNIDICNQSLLELYGIFINKPYNTDDIKSRFLLMDRDSHKIFNIEWFRPNNATYTSYVNDVPDFRAFVDSQGLFVEGSLNLDLSNEETKEKIISNFDSIENAEKELIHKYIEGIIAHELAHLYQRPNLPLEFAETGAEFYSREIAYKNNYEKPNDFQAIKRYIFYSKLQKQYGDTIHKIFFGNKVFTEDIINVRSEFTPDVMTDLFPDFNVTRL